MSLINKGGIAKQVVGLLWRAINPFYHEPDIYYCLSTEKVISAEIDYAIQHDSAAIPVEVKTSRPAL